MKTLNNEIMNERICVHTFVLTFFPHLQIPSPHLSGPVFTIILQYCLFSVMSAVSSYVFISFRLLSIHLRPLLPFPGTAMSIICLDMLSSSLLLICPYEFNRFCFRNVVVWHTLVYSCIIWFLACSFMALIHVDVPLCSSI